MAASCLSCGAPLPTDSSPLRKTCGTSCRVRLHYARKRDAQEAALALLLRQSRAIQDCDAGALEAIARETETLLGGGEVTGASSALITYDGVPVRHVLIPATSARHAAALQAEADAQVAHRADCRESCARLSGERNPVRLRPNRKR